MNIQTLADMLQEVIDHGTNPEQPVMIFDANTEKILEVRSFTYGKEVRLFVDED